MALAELLDSQTTNFSDLHPVEKATGNSALEQYIALQQTEFYDKKNQQWRNGLGWRTIDDQFVGLLLDLSLIGAQKARENYEKLKNSGFYLPFKKKWISPLYEEDHDNITKERTSFPRYYIYDLLIESELYSKQNAKKKYKDLTKQDNSCYDRELGQWRYTEGSSFRLSYDQLLDTYALAKLYGREPAHEKYNKIKQAFFEDSTGLWIPSRTSSSKQETPGYNLHDQILGIIDECLFDKELALKQFTSVKEKFYDKNDDKWICGRDGNIIIKNDKSMLNQLLLVLLQKELEPKKQFTSTNPIPEIRKF